MSTGPLGPVPGDLTGRLIGGRLEIKEKLGEGGMGAVYRAWHTLMEKSLAIKVLHPEIGMAAQLGQRFQREAQSASRLDHPGVVHIYDFGQTEDGLLFLVMEHLSGRSLAEVLEERRRLPVGQALDIARQICLALDHAHGHGVVHRDLKPDNVMVLEERGKEGRIKLLDFGIAKVLHGDGGASNLTQAGSIFGTPAYMAPEQAAGDAVDHRADLYALGVMLFEMLAGAKPFQGETSAKLLFQHLSEPPPSLLQVSGDPSLPVSLTALVGRLMAKEPEKRFQTALEVAEALQAIERELGLVSNEDLRRLGSSGELPAVSTFATGSGATSFPAPGAPARGPTVALAPRPISTYSLPGLASAPTSSQMTGGGPFAGPQVSGPHSAQRVAGTRSASDPRRRRVVIIASAAGGVMFVILIVIIALLPGSDRPGEKRPPASAGTADGMGGGPRALPGPARAASEEQGTAIGPIDGLLGRSAPPEQVRRAEALLVTGKTDEALIQIRTLVTRHPRDWALHLLEAHACQQKKRHVECLASYEQAVRLRSATKDDGQLLALLYELLTSARSGVAENQRRQRIALEFVLRHYQEKIGVEAAATQMLTRFVNQGKDAASIWAVIAILEAHGTHKGVDYVHAYRQRLASEQSCVVRRTLISTMVSRKEPAFIPLLQEVVRQRTFRAPSGKYSVENECIREDAKKAIFALGGNPGDIPAGPTESGRRRASSGFERTLNRIFQ